MVINIYKCACRLEEQMEKTSILIAVIMVWHKHKATEVSSAQNSTLWNKVAQTLVEKYRCVEIKTIDLPVLKIHSFK